MLLLSMLDQFNTTIFHRISKTWGSGPLFCTLSNRHQYYCKKNNKIIIPFTDLINEVLVNRLLSGWGIKTPEICLVNFEFNVFQNELEAAFNEIAEEAKARNAILKNHYVANRFVHPLFGSKYIINHSGLSGNAAKDSFDLDKFSNPTHILLIGFFDLWISNKDRKPSNSNLIKSLNEDEKFDIVAIDNCQAFYNNNSYVNLLDSVPFLTPEESILTCGLAQQLIDTLSKEQISDLSNLALSFIENSLPLLDETFDEIPNSWGLSENNRVEIRNFLSNKKRIEDIRQKFISFVEL